MVIIPPISARWPFLVYPDLFTIPPSLGTFSAATVAADCQDIAVTAVVSGEEEMANSEPESSATDVRLLSENRWLVERPTISQCFRGEVELPEWVANCRVAQKYIELLGPLDWENFPEPDRGSPPGPVPDPMRAFAAIFLVKLNEEKEYMPAVRDYLLDHPSLVWLFGFRLEPALDSIYGFDVEASLPTSRHMNRVLRNCDNQAYQFLLDSTVELIGDALPEGLSFGQEVSGDTKHILAWVRENNPKERISNRYDPKRQPKGDPDCKLGVKERRNRSPSDKKKAYDGQAASDSKATATKKESASQTSGKSAEQKATASKSSAASASKSHSPQASQASDKRSNNKPDASTQTPTKDGIPASQKKIEDVTYYWGYASGVLATIIPNGWGEVVLSEYTQTFNESDISYFYPLMNEAERRLGFRPTHGAFDKAFDAQYVYEHFDEVGGFAAVPFRQSGGHPIRIFDSHGLPLCAAGLGMPLHRTYNDRTARVPHQKGRYGCPLLIPNVTGQSCPIEHKKWPTGGCMTTMATSNGARVRYQLKRESDEYKAIYKQRTATERINSRAKELGIERPKLRNRKSITNINTLIYVLMNLRIYDKIEKRKAGIFE